MAKEKMIKPQSGKDQFWGVVYIIVGVLVFFLNPSIMWKLSLLFFVMAIAKFWLSKRHRSKEEKAMGLIERLRAVEESEEYSEDEEDSAAQSQKVQRSLARLSVEQDKEHLAEEHQKFLDDLEDELGDFETDDEDDEYNEDDE